MTPTEESPATHQQRHQSDLTHQHHQQHHEEEMLMMVPARAKLVDVNEYLTCHLCRGYLIDATTITECLHSFCRSCILKFLQDNSHCPVCDLVINTAKPNLKPDKSMQDIVYKLVPELFLREMGRRRAFYRTHPTTASSVAAPAAKLTPEQRGEDTERTIFNAKEMFSLSLEYASEDNSLIHSPITGGHLAASVAPRTREEHVRSARTNNGTTGTGGGGTGGVGDRLDDNGSLLKRYLHCPGMCRIDVLKKFVSTKYNVNCAEYYIDILYKRVPLPGHYTLIDIAYIYSWKRNAPMKFFFRISDLSQAKDNCEYYIPLTELPIVLSSSIENIPKSSVVKTVKKAVHKSRIKNPEPIENKTVEIVQSTKEIVTPTVISSQDKECETPKNALELKPPHIKINEPCSIEIKPEKVEPPQENYQSKVVERFIKSAKHEPFDENPAKLLMIEAKLTVEPHIQTDKLTPEEKPQQKPLKLIINVPKHLTDSLHQTTQNTITTSSKPTNKTPKSSPTKLPPTPEKLLLSPSSTKPPTDLKFDEEKQNFLKSFELAARDSLPTKSPTATNTSIANEMKQYKLATEIKQIKPLPAVVPSLASSVTPLQKLVLKRKQTSQLHKMERQQKRSKNSHLLKIVDVTEYQKIAPKVLLPTSPPIETVKELIKQSQQDYSSKKLTATTTSALQSLFGNCNINIPSSLSITLKETSADTVMTPIKPVINHIEILKLPDSPLPLTETNSRPIVSEMCLDRLDLTVSTTTVPIGNSQKIGMHPNLPAKVTMPSNSTEIKTVPINGTSSSTSSATTQCQRLISTSFQRMFEEAIRKPEFTQKIHAYPVKQLKEDVVISTAATSEAGPDSPDTPANAAVGTTSTSKRNLMEITSQLVQLSKKSKVEAIAAPKPATPPLVLPQQVQVSTTTTITTRPAAMVLPVVMNANGKVAIPRLAPSNWKSSSVSANSVVPQQTVANLHSASLGMNYTVSINQQNSNGTINAKVNAVDSPKSSPKHVSSSSAMAVVPKAKSPSLTNGTTAKSQMSYLELTKGLPPQEFLTVEMPKTSPVPRSVVNGNVPVPPKVSSPRVSTSTSPNQDSTFTNGLLPLNLTSPNNDNITKVPKTSPHGLLVPKLSPNLPSQSTDSTTSTPMNNAKVKPAKPSSKSSTNKKKTKTPKRHSANTNTNVGVGGSANNNQEPLNPNELLEKYNIQNLAQLTAGWNLGTQLMSMAAPSTVAANQLAFQQAMLLKHFEIQNRQNWLNSTNPLMVEYTKYLQQTLNAAAQQQSAPAHKQQTLKEN